MAAGAAGEGIIRGMLEGSISGHDTGINKRPYHKNCGCALHNTRRRCHHQPRQAHVSYPIRRSWSEGCLALVAAAAAAGAGASPQSPSPSCSPSAAAASGSANLPPRRNNSLVFAVGDEDLPRLGDGDGAEGFGSGDI